MSNKQQVRDFFDDMAPTYQQRYSADDLVLMRSYSERIGIAMSAIRSKQPRILDIGCGTGSFYDALLQQYPELSYQACDISPKMLEFSTIPASQRKLGSAYELDWGDSRFDLVSMLGVTTYFSNEELVKYLEFIQNRLAKNGKAAITFTNKKAIGVVLRNLLKPLLQPFISKKRVQAQPFTINCYSPKSVLVHLPKSFKVESVSYFNYLIPGLKLISPKLAARTSEWFFKNKFWSKRLAGDFMLILSIEVV